MIIEVLLSGMRISSLLEVPSGSFRHDPDAWSVLSPGARYQIRFSRSSDSDPVSMPVLSETAPQSSQALGIGPMRVRRECGWDSV
jgi:hypothetical protein